MSSFSGLLNNAALMLMLCVIYDTFNIHSIRNETLRDSFTGILVGGIAIAVMLTPWSLKPGVFFDSRWVLLSLCGLFFNFRTTIIAIVIAGSFRLYQGGAGGVVGTIVIISTAFTGVGWRYVKEKRQKPLRALELYFFGVVVQLVMLACMLLMPKEMQWPIIKAVAPPILSIYPFLTMLLGLILKRQEDRRETDKALKKEIQDRKIAEEAARKSKEAWEKTFNAITDTVSLQDKDQRIVEINQAGCDSLGLEKEQIIGKFCYKLFNDLDHPCPDCPIRKTIESLKPCTGETKSPKLKKTVLVSGSPVFDSRGNLINITHIAKDITEMKNLQAELVRAQKMESIGTLAGGIAHDFNNILSAIMGYAELAKDNMSSGYPVDDEIDQIIKSSVRAAELVRQILTFSRKSSHLLEPFPPDKVVSEALQMLRASIPSTINIIEEIDENCGEIMADQVNIHQIIINLCTNSLHAMENEKGTLTVRLYPKEINEQEAAGYAEGYPGTFIVLEVGDTGHGMDQSTMEQIFDPFFSTKEVGKGTGLGLSVLHGIIQDYQGFVRVTSRPGKGTTFFVFIPALGHNSNALANHQIDDVLPHGEGHILLVDDEPMIVTLNRQVLERLGYTVYATTDSKEALDRFTADPSEFDLVITDQTMPDLTGVELSGKLLELRKDIPIILCTGYSAVVNEEQALDAGIKKQLEKPVSRKELAQAIKEVLGRQ